MPADTQAADARYTRGRDRLAEVDGDAGEQIVDSLGDLGRYVVEFAFGDIYNRPGLSLRDRELVSVAMLAVMGAREPQLDLHLQGALNVGVTVEELRELMIHVVPYAGFPAAINGMRRLQALEQQAPERAP
jgi:4-carboxymuconolactone decarboxylase